jgi:hypothetical protein
MLIQDFKPEEMSKEELEELFKWKKKQRI